MRPEFKTFEFKVEDAETEGKIRGFASTFGNIDLGDDVVDKGAFKKTIKDSKGLVPILADHDPSKQIGWNLRAEETEKGLYVEGQIDLNTQLGREKFSLARKAVEIGAKMGLSIGYGTVKAEPDKERPRVRRLKELKLYEYSIVTFPMNTDAMITAAKNFDRDSKLKQIISLIQEEGFSEFEIQNALTKSAAAESFDPANMDQSLDRLIKTLKGE